MADPKIFAIFVDSDDPNTWYAANLYAEPDNFKFEKAGSIKILAQALQAGDRDAIIQQLPKLFQSLNGMEAGDVFENLFGETNRATLRNDDLYSAPAGKVLADFLVPLGDALAAAAAGI